MICPKCQNELREGAKFCDGCGSDISKASQLERNVTLGKYDKYDIDDDFEDTIITGPGGMPAKSEDGSSNDKSADKKYEDFDADAPCTRQQTGIQQPSSRFRLQ